jgi:hypothetical protein
MFRRSSNNILKRAKLMKNPINLGTTKVNNKYIFTKAKVVPRELTLDDIIKLIKSGNCSEAFYKIAKSLTRIERVKFGVDFIRNSKFKSFKYALESFIRVMGRYLNDGDSDNIKIYRDNLQEDYSSELHSKFVMYRRFLIEDALKDDSKFFTLAIDEYINVMIFECEKDYEDYYRELVVELASIKWKDAKALKVLFGDK